MTIAALVLAGGKSRRMGRDKALLTVPTPCGPRSLLAHISHIANSCTHRTYVLTPWPDRYRQLTRAVSVVYLTEKRQGAGPLVALSQGWSMVLSDYQRRCEPVPDWLLVLACDLPALSENTLQTWCGQLSQIETPAIAALPHHQNRWEPLCGFYHRRCISPLNRAVEQNERSFQRWLAGEPVVPLNVDDSNMLQNCNTPAQWQNFLDHRAARNP